MQKNSEDETWYKIPEVKNRLNKSLVEVSRALLKQLADLEGLQMEEHKEPPKAQTQDFFRMIDAVRVGVLGDDNPNYPWKEINKALTE